MTIQKNIRYNDQKFISIIITFLLFNCQYLFSQTFEWAKAFNGHIGGPFLETRVMGYSVAVDDSGNVFTTGGYMGSADFDPGVGIFYMASNSAWDVYISKLNKDGNFLWAKSFGGISTNAFGTPADVGYGIVTDREGNVYVCGSFENTVDFDPGSGIYNLSSTGGENIFVMKLDPDGNFLWAKSFGDGWANSIAIDNESLYSTGYSQGRSFVMKMDTAGNFIWSKSLTGDTNQGNSISIDNEGNILTTGYYSRTVDFDPGPGVFNLISDSYSWDAYILKLDRDGYFLWVKSTAGIVSEVGNSITTDQDGNVLITGYFEVQADFDPGPNSYTLNVVNKMAGGNLNQDIFIMKLDKDGNFIWAKSFGGKKWSNGNSIKTDRFGNVYTTGFFGDEADFDPGPNTFIVRPSISNKTPTNIFISKLNFNGDFVNALGIGDHDNYYSFRSNCIFLDNSFNIYMTGDFIVPGDFDPGPDVFNLEFTRMLNDAYILKLSQCQATSDTANISTCGSYTWLDGKTYTESTDTARYIIENKAGCDSIITLDLTILKSDTTNTSTTACNEYKWYDLTLNQSGIYQHTEPKMNGCDSVLTLNLTILKPDSVQYQISSCDEYTWYNINYTESGTYLHNEINTNGCDSIGILNLTINRSGLSQMSMTSCDSLTWNGQTYNQSGIYQFKTQTTAGCDSLITLDLKINKSDYITIKHSTCDSFSWNGTKYMQSGNYMYSTKNKDGCDSLTILELTISDNIERTDEISICDGDSIKIFGNWVTEKGSISETFTSSSGCDSIQIYNISVLQLPEGNISGSICEGDSVFIIDRWFDVAGTYTLKKSNPAGCDSLIEVNISIIKNKINYDTLSLCRGDTLNIAGQIITTQTDIQKNLTSAELCDSLVYVHVRMLEPAKSSQEIRLCPGDSIYIAGRWINSAQEVEETYQGSNGCDSTAVKNIRLIPEPDKPEMEIDCESGEIKLSINSSADWQILWNNGENSHNATYKDSTEAIVNLKAIEGCERQFTIQLPQIPDITLIKQPNDTILKEAEILQIDLGLNLSEWKIGWQPDDALDCDTCSKVNITVGKNTEFVIKLKHESGCEYELRFRVEIENGKFDVPNIFSPDGDSKNDFWKVGIPTGIELQQCSIYDRWGEKVYSTSGEIKWDGRIRQKNAMQGVYVYVIEYKDEAGETRFLSGDVTLIR